MEESKALAGVLLLAFDKGVEVTECRALPTLGFIGRCSNLQGRGRLRASSPAGDSHCAKSTQEFTSSKRLPQGITPFSGLSHPLEEGSARPEFLRDTIR